WNGRRRCCRGQLFRVAWRNAPSGRGASIRVLGRMRERFDAMKPYRTLRKICRSNQEFRMYSMARKIQDGGLAMGEFERFDGPNRREFLYGTLAASALTAVPRVAWAAAANDADKEAVLAQIPKMHGENVKRLQEWIALPSIAAENRN